MKKFPAFLLVFMIMQSVFADMTCDTNISKYRARYEINSYTCQSGYYLPANTLGCVACPSGFTCNGGTFDFNPDIFQGISFDAIPASTINNVCATNFPTKLRARYAPNTHTCSAGTYLPANVDSCTQCPANSYCAGGTYTFNETTDQGISGQCDNGYSSLAGSSSASDCVANTITVRWDDGNGGAYTTTCTYGGTLTTPSTPPVAPKGYHFTGWTFNLGN